MGSSRVFLLPGEMCVSEEPVEIATLLGSCVAVCLFNKKLQCGGMNHFMLPKTPIGDTPSGKHGDYVTEHMIRMMKALDAQTQNLEAYVIGGGNVTGHLTVGTGIGANNIVTALSILENHRISVTKKHIGGNLGRKVYFKNWTGEIEVRMIEKSDQTKLMQEKRQALNQRSIKVLLVDDSETIRDIMTRALSEDPGIEVVGGAANPYEARELLLEHDPDVICLDVIMPKMDGITFLKKLFQFKPKPVIVISTIVQKGSAIREQAKKIGAVEVIDKEELEMYKGLDVIRTMLVSKIKAAANVWVTKKTKEELDQL